MPFFFTFNYSQGVYTMTENTHENVQLDENQMQEMFEQLHRQHFIEQFGPMLQELVELKLDTGNYYNVNRSADSEYRCVVVNNDSIKPCHMEEGGLITQQTFTPEEGDKIIWVVNSNNFGRHIVVQKGFNIESDFEILHDGNIRAHYAGSDLGYLANFIASIGSDNFVLLRDGDREKFSRVEALVKQAVGENHQPVLHLLVSILMRTEKPEDYLTTWDNATVLTDDTEIEYGINIVTRENKITTSTIRRLVVWEKPVVLDAEGNQVEEDHIVVTTRHIHEQATPSLLNDMDVNLVAKHVKTPSHWKAVMVITEDHIAEEGIQPIKLFKREDYNLEV